MSAIDSRIAILRFFGFLALSAVAVLAVGPIAGSIRPASTWMFAVLVSVALSLVTWAAVRIEGQRLDSLGLVPTRRRRLEFAWGFAAASLVFAAVALARAAAVGASWALDLANGSRAALVGLPFALVLLLPEELLFRGYAFQKAVALWGGVATVVASALAFGAYHVVGSGHGGMGAAFPFLTSALGGLVFGYAALRTGGLALPIGIHLGGNWVQASVLGLGNEKGDALWTASLTPEQTVRLTSPDVLPHLPYLLGLAVVGALVAPAALRHLELRIPPLAVFAGFAAAILALGRAVPAAVMPFPGHRTVAALSFLAGLATAWAGILEFRRARTTLSPFSPGSATSVVTSGIYRWTRNPMYLGMALALVGVAAWHSSLIGYALVPLFAAYMTRFQIVPEERALLVAFGDGFRSYARDVRRWI